MAKLRISPFLSIEKAEIELGRINVLIGPQAQGKSLVVKLIHFFEGLVKELLLDVVSGERRLQLTLNESVEKFEEYFPKYAWGTQEFEVRFEHENVGITLSRQGKRTNAPAKLVLDTAFLALIQELATGYKDAYRSAEGASSRTPLKVIMRRNALRSVLSKCEPISNWFAVNSVFVPASRAFLANIEKNIFTLISNKYELDKFMAEFGAALERIRSSLLLSARMHSHARKRRSRGPAVREAGWEEIIHGHYVFDGEEEFVESSKRVVRLANSSSGQQEAIPLLLVLSHVDILGRSPMIQVERGASIVIEEPEAHLFPKAQREIARLITNALNNHDSNRVVFTTHSPYMLTAINNLILAGQLYERTRTNFDEEELLEIKKIVQEHHAIRPGQLQAYGVQGGKVTSIVDSSTGLINAYLVDEVSQDFNEEFTKLMKLKHRGLSTRQPS